MAASVDEMIQKASAVCKPNPVYAGHGNVQEECSEHCELACRMAARLRWLSDDIRHLDNFDIRHLDNFDISTEAREHLIDVLEGRI